SRVVCRALERASRVRSRYSGGTPTAAVRRSSEVLSLTLKTGEIESSTVSPRHERDTCTPRHASRAPGLHPVKESLSRGLLGTGTRAVWALHYRLLLPCACEPPSTPHTPASSDPMGSRHTRPERSQNRSNARDFRGRDADWLLGVRKRMRTREAT